MFEFLRKNPVEEPLTPQSELPALPAAVEDRQESALAESLPVAPEPMPMDNVIAERSQIRGSIETAGSLGVAGIVEGDIGAEGAVEVGLQGRVHGDVTGEEIVVSGHVVGNIYARGKLTITCSGQVEGEVHARSIANQDGGVLQGRCHMGKPAERPQPVVAPAPVDEQPGFLARIVDDESEAAAPALAYA